MIHIAVYDAVVSYPMAIQRMECQLAMMPPDWCQPALGFFAIGQFAVRTFRRKDSSP